MGHLGQKKVQNDVFGRFIVQNTLVLGDFAYFDQE